MSGHWTRRPMSLNTEDAAAIQLLDVLLTKVVRLQDLLPGGIATSHGRFVRHVGSHAAAAKPNLKP